MNLLIPMAGDGSRFQIAGYNVPKPLIQVLGKSMYRWAVDSFDISSFTNVVFAIRNNDYKIQLVKDIEENYPNAKIVILDKKTRGQSETVFLMKNFVDMTVPTWIHNADTHFTSKDKAWQSAKNWDGSLVVFHSTESKWSFAKTDENGFVTDVQEKNPVSTHASAGAYFFRNTPELFRLMSEQIRQVEMEKGEFYIAPLYKKLIATQKKIGIYQCSEVFCFGTPEDLNSSLRNMKE